MREFIGKALTSATVLLTTIAVLAACGAESDLLTSPGETPPPETTTDLQWEYAVTLYSISAVKDCDDEGFPTTIVDNDTEGEFAYRFTISWPNGEKTVVAATNEYPRHMSGNAVLRLGSGTSLALGSRGTGIRHNRFISGPRVLAITVTFEATEWDSRIDGWYSEERLDEAVYNRTYSRRTGQAGVSDTISLGNNLSKCNLSANLRVELHPVRAE